MKRSINSTGRQRITHSMVSFNILRTITGEPKSFTVNFDGLAVLNLPETAQISVEPYFGHSSMRFDFGTIGAISAPAETSLNEIDKGGEINFRVKVIDDGNAGRLGRLLAAGDRLAASPPGDAEQGQMPLLPVKPEWLGERIWDVSIADGERPYLLVNSRIPGLASRIQDDPLLRGAILVEAFRKILSVMLDPDSGDEASWVPDWKTFLNTVLAVSYPDDLDPDDDDKRIDFISDALKAFSDRFQFATHSLPSGTQEEASND
jgi:hypothetical protein